MSMSPLIKNETLQTESSLEKTIEHMENIAVKATVLVPESFQRFHNMHFIYLCGMKFIKYLDDHLLQIIIVITDVIDLFRDIYCYSYFYTVNG